MPVRNYCTCANITTLIFLLYGVNMFVTFYNMWSPPTFSGPVHKGISPQWDVKESVDITVYQSTSSTRPSKLRDEDLLWTLRSHDLQEEATLTIDLPITDRMREKKAQHAHIFVTPPNASPSVQDNILVHATASITKTSECRSNTTRTLLSAASEEQKSDERAVQKSKNKKKCPFLKPKVLIRVVTDSNVYHRDTIPPDIAYFMKAFQTPNGLRYAPRMFVDEMWLVPNLLLPINNETHLQLELTYAPISIGLTRIMSTLNQALDSVKDILGEDSSEADNLRESLTGTAPLLLAVTFGVAMVHLLLDVLAFKNDISFWAARKDMVGLSFNAVRNQLVMSFIVALYLHDNKTGWLILAPAIGMVFVNVFKLYKATKLGQAHSVTASADSAAMKWMVIILTPCVIGYATYSLMYHEHRGWWSWFIQVAASAVYGGGFVLMTPQLFINYQLKSVAALPWKVFFYKACSTFIDDLFAFIIKMPNMHRAAAFRDDIIFLVYLYQRWLYPVDHNRPIEGGEKQD
eukprot:TRINITY_DN61085_c0_g1_i1.p1 TRINITY_DN61085_c0_g1~~TRINITY_DN61085_c0_g1_i1.p1  ORF type:complete len:518 (+),score=18.12 TRINITY_DN61085_c0_g1_i1:53-1606(+)